MRNPPQLPFAELRRSLLRLEAAGPTGFEGLLAACLSEFSGMTFRLAVSGSQFGRDATSITGSTLTIAMEAKRYSTPPRLEDIVGKAVVAAGRNAELDVWVVGVTSPLGDVTAQEAAAQLEEKGVTLLVLDWSKHGLPRLAALLASANRATERWYAEFEPEDELAVVSSLLERVRSHPDFNRVKTELLTEVSASTVGYAALRSHAADWLRRRLKSRSESKRSFGQFLTPADPDEHCIERVGAIMSFRSAIATAMLPSRDAEPRAEPPAPPVIAVLGDDGVGKSWLVAQWWNAASPEPICLFVAGRRAEDLRAGKSTGAVDALARIIAEQEGKVDVSVWLRRLRRWASHSPAVSPRFVVVLDGMNERVSYPWADIIGEFAQELTSLCGILVVTCRSAFWEASVAPRLDRLARVTPVHIGPYSDDELNTLLIARHIAPATLSETLRASLKNPRLARIALELASKTGRPLELISVEHVLISYFRSRVDERGSGLRHTYEDFAQVIVAHARAFLKNQERPFALDEWAERSGPAKRLGREHASDDLYEISQGRFLTPGADPKTSYTFRPELLPVALGMLIISEVKSVVCASDSASDSTYGERIAQITDPLSGVDRVASVLLSAVGLACLDDSLEPGARRAILRAWLSSHNVSVDQPEVLRSYICERPDVFLDMVEAEETEVGRVAYPDALVSLLHELAAHSQVKGAIAERLPRWLGYWSLRGSKRWDIVGSPSLRVDRDAAVAARIGKLTQPEQEVFGRLTWRTEEPRDAPLARSAASLLRLFALAPFANAVVGFTLAAVVAKDPDDANDSILWAMLLNEFDPVETSLAVARAVDELCPDPNHASPAALQASAYALRLAGGLSNDRRADELFRREHGVRQYRAQMYCETDPFDPATAPGLKLRAARTLCTQLDASLLWSSMQTRDEDFDLEQATPALLRFLPDELCSLLNDVAATAPTRDWPALRHLASHLTWASPILSSTGIAAVRAGYLRLVGEFATARQLPTERHAFEYTAAQLCAAVLPHVTGDEQLKLLTCLPKTTVLFTILGQHLRPMSDSCWDTCVAALEANADAEVHATDVALLRWMLFHALRSERTLDARAASAIVPLIQSTDEALQWLSVAIARQAGSPVLDEAVVAAMSEGHLAEEIGKSSALATEVNVILARRLGAEASNALSPAQCLALSIRAPRSVPLDRDSLIRALLWSESPSTNDELFVSSRRGTQQDESDTVHLLPVDVLGEFAARHADELQRWCYHTLDGPSANWVRQMENAAVIAGALGPLDAALSVQVLRQIYATPRHVRTRVDGVLLADRSLFLVSGDHASALQHERFTRCETDAEVEALVRAAERVDGACVLDRLMVQWFASPCRRDLALGLTVAGLRSEATICSDWLARDWGTGVIGDIAVAARRQYRRAQCAQHWLSEARCADSIHDAWRFSSLASLAADVRVFDALLRSARDSWRFPQLLAELVERTRRAADARTKRRGNTLFGLRPPGRVLRFQHLDTAGSLS